MNNIRDVFSRARGVFERIGAPFEYYDIKFDQFISINVSPLKASISISSETLVNGIRPTPNLISFALSRQGVTFGLKMDKIHDLIKDGAYDTEIVVAEGIPPEPGIDAKISMEIQIDPDCTPTIDKSGRTNFRNIKSFSTVRENQIIARRFPPKPGKPGRSVTGDEIESKDGQDVNLPNGKNTKVSEDGTHMTSAKTGVVYKYDNLIHVRELLDIPKNVDFSVGNIKYSGDVVIRGDVKPGFTIEAEGDISITGEVESAMITSRQGFVQIAKGVIGKGGTRIFGEKGIAVNFAQDVNIITPGILSVEKHLLHCNCKCSILKADLGNTSIIGGNMIIYDFAEVTNIGNDKFIPTKVSLVDLNKEKLKEKITELEEFKEKVEKSLEPVKRELKTKSVLLKKAGNNATDRQKKELKKWLDQYNNLNMKIKYIDGKVEEVEGMMKNPSFYNGYINAKGNVFPGVEINMYDLDKKCIDTKITKKVVKIENNVIKIEEEKNEC
jgi:hypothetical protein